MDDINKQQEEFELIREKIKSRPLNKKKLLRRVIVTVLMAIIFGAFACITFFLLEKYFTNVLTPSNEPVAAEIKIPVDKSETLPEDMMLVEEEESQAKPPVIVIESSSDINILEEYGHLYSDLAELVKVLKRSLVTVTGVRENVDWFNTSYENVESTTGIIVANNGIELLMLTDYTAIKNFETINVTFFNGLIAEATLKETDKNTGLAVVAVPTSILNSTLLDESIVANLGNSRLNSIVAAPVIALGRPLGNVDSVEYGMVTSKSNVLSMSDSNYELITTDIYGNELSNGVLFSISGSVIGFINQKSGVVDVNTISAIGISDIKSTIERMSNGKPRPYLGIRGTDVTVQATNNGVPPGAYVKKIDVNSPALRAGIQGGDVICKFNGSDITTFTVLSQIIAECSPDQEVEVVLMRPNDNEYVKITMNVTLGSLD